MAANDILNRMALRLAERWKIRVLAVDWGPWEKAGMVTEEIKQQFLQRGVGLIQPEQGVKFLLDELKYGAQDEPVIVALAQPPSPTK